MPSSASAAVMSLSGSTVLEPQQLVRLLRRRQSVRHLTDAAIRSARRARPVDDPEQFLDRRDPEHHLREAVFGHPDHAFVERNLSQTVVIADALYDARSQRAGRDKDFVNVHAAAVSGVMTVWAASGAEEL